MSTLTTQAAAPTTVIPALHTRGYELDADHVGPMRTSEPFTDPNTLNDRIKDQGYLYLPGLLDRDQVLEARHSVLNTLAKDGGFKAGTDPNDGIVDPQSGASPFRPDVAKDDQALQRVLYEGPMIGFFERLFDARVRHFDFTWLRAIKPGIATASHCDVVYMGRGEVDQLFTVWTPLGDIDWSMGGLALLEGSHRNERLKATYGQYDVDTYCTNRPEVDGWKNEGQLKGNPNQIRRSVGGTWRVTQFAAGDVVVFTMHTIHAGLDNHTDRLRLSTDTRYQPAHRPADERWIGANPIGHGQAGKRGRVC